MIPVILLINIFLLYKVIWSYLLFSFAVSFFWWGLHCAVVHQIKSTAANRCQMPSFMTWYWLSDYFHSSILTTIAS